MGLGCRTGKDPRPSLDSSVGTCELRDFLPNFWHRDADQRPSAQECVEKLASMELPSMKLGFAHKSSMLLD